MAWERRWERIYHQLDGLQRTTAAAPGLVTPDYMAWYIPVSHRCILPTTVPAFPPVAVPAPDPAAEQAVLQDLMARFARGDPLSPEERAFLLGHWQQ